jgi:PAS domain S-box-containing protein
MSNDDLELLRESHARWLSVASNPFDYLVVVDRKGVFRWVNHVAPGLSREALIDRMSIFDFLDDASKVVARAALDRAFDERVPVYYEGHSPGLEFTVGSVVAPIEGDRPVRLATILTRDLTRVKKLERDVRRQEVLLAESQRIAGIGTWVLPPGTGPGGEAEWSDELRRILGVPRGTPGFVQIVRELVLDHDLAKFDRYLRLIREGGTEEPLEIQIRRASDGALRDLRVKADQFADSRGERLGILGTVLDITELRTLERQLGRAPGPIPRAEPRRAAAPPIPKENVAILIVEDEATVLELAARVLTSLGYRVRTASSFEEAMSIWSTSKDEIGLLFTDVVLPGRSGTDIASEMRKDRPDLRILFTSGYAGEGWDLGVDPRTSFLPKPYVPTALARAIEAMLVR